MSNETKEEVLKKTKVCTGCRQLKPGADYTAFRTQQGKYQLMAKCKLCRASAESDFRAKGGRREHSAEARKFNGDQYYHHQEKSLEGATNNRKEWTGPELEMLARKELKATYLAETLGRTVYSIRRMRAKVIHDARKRDLAGIPEAAQ